MSTGKQRDGAKGRFWRRVVRQWRQSGLSVRAFCAQHGLSEASFYAWRRALNRRDTAAVSFVPVAVVSEERSASAGVGACAGLELVVGRGRVVRVGPGFDAPTLQRLLALLEEGRAC